MMIKVNMKLYLEILLHAKIDELLKIEDEIKNITGTTGYFKDIEEKITNGEFKVI